ncbi:hypothetical protein FACS189479_02890 [Spirochaetia bacterium]|nr:hypothetical protein FACS189479_02890 [Spirochaetia bacterium]
MGEGDSSSAILALTRPAQLLIILAFILAGGFFILFEHALASSRKPRLRTLAGHPAKLPAEQPAKLPAAHPKYQPALEAAEDPLLYFSISRIWVIFLRLSAGVLGGLWLVLPLGNALNTKGLPGDIPAIAAVIAGITLAAVLLGDFLPRFIALIAPEKICAACIPVIRALALPCKPLLILYGFSDALVRKLFRIDGEAGNGMTEDELLSALAEGEKSGVVESKERTMVEGVFYLGDRPSGAFMTHRSEIQWLDIDAGAEEIRTMAREHGAQGCFPVVDGTLDEIIGGVFLEDILQALSEGFPQGLKPLIKKVGFIPETMSALKAFEAFKQGETDHLFVMDEYGGFAGLLSVRDLIEEIVGQLSEGESKEEGIFPQEDGTWLADGSASIDDIAAVLDLSSLTESHQDYHTLAGFILFIAGEIPKTAASFSYNGFNFKITDMDGNRIDKVRISKIPAHGY